MAIDENVEQEALNLDGTSDVEEIDGATVIEAAPMPEGEQPLFDFSRFSFGDGERFAELLNLLNAASEGKTLSAKEQKKITNESMWFLCKTCRSIPAEWWADEVPSDPDYRDVKTYHLVLEDKIPFMLVGMVNARGARYQQTIDDAKNLRRL